MRRLRYLGLCGLLVVALLLAALPVFAAEEGPESSPLTPLFQWINFAIVAGFLGWLLVKKAPGFFGSRAAQIASAIEEGTRLKKQAEAKRDEARRRLANLATELEELRAASRRDAAAENGRIQAATREEAAKIDHAAQMEVEAAARSARLELRALGAKLAVERAEVLLRAELSPAAEDGIFTAFLGELTAPGGQAGRVN